MKYASLLLSLIVSPCFAQTPAIADVAELLKQARTAAAADSTSVPSHPHVEARLEAELITHFVKDINANIVIKMADQGGTPIWEIQTWRQCPSFPCTPTDFMEKAIVNPTVIEDSRAVDGTLVLKLNDAMTVVQASGFREPEEPKPATDYTLIYILNGKTMELPLYMVSGIRTR